MYCPITEGEHSWELIQYDVTVSQKQEDNLLFFFFTTDNLLLVIRLYKRQKGRMLRLHKKSHLDCLAILIGCLFPSTIMWAQRKQLFFSLVLEECLACPMHPIIIYDWLNKMYSTFGGRCNCIQNMIFLEKWWPDLNQNNISREVWSNFFFFFKPNKHSNIQMRR